MNLHQAKADHTAEKLHDKYTPHSGLSCCGGVHHDDVSHPHHPVGAGSHPHQPVGAVDPITGTTAPTYPLGGHPATGHHHNKYI